MCQNSKLYQLALENLRLLPFFFSSEILAIDDLLYPKSSMLGPWGRTLAAAAEVWGDPAVPQRGSGWRRRVGGGR